MKKPEQIAAPTMTGANVAEHYVEGIAVRWSLGYYFDGPHRVGKVAGSIDAGRLTINGVEYRAGGELDSYAARVWADEDSEHSRERFVPVRVWMRLTRGDFGDPTDAARKAVQFIADAITKRVQALTTEEIAILAGAAVEREVQRCEQRAAEMLREAELYRARAEHVAQALAEAIAVAVPA